MCATCLADSESRCEKFVPNPPWTRLMRSRFGNPLASTPCRVWAPLAHRSESLTPPRPLGIEAEPLIQIRGDLES